ncbi:uncharacterized protein TM35_001481010 [Trypanosoma theileri]|uniref:Uncharacterized protein n=1 Tax=Trypanosoma theileri TaxID=67003 RepID=A0A1X0NDM3_9TRYP|nr:uncharacterized protein TM35_001481010 [Trypanosoma theileri]ORC80728.1 hypothetical protein TM35_001481010 [Trypanosoma theileri]
MPVCLLPWSWGPGGSWNFCWCLIIPNAHILHNNVAIAVWGRLCRPTGRHRFLLELHNRGRDAPSRSGHCAVSSVCRSKVIPMHYCRTASRWELGRASRSHANVFTFKPAPINSGLSFKIGFSNSMPAVLVEIRARCLDGSVPFSGPPNRRDTDGHLRTGSDKPHKLGREAPAH